MSGNRHRPIAVFLATIWLTGCARAPSFDVLGSFFPAWLLCLAVGLLLAFASHWLLLRLGIVVAVPVLTYPSLTVLFACALWLACFR
ncbi:MAG TPA: YtcA family lipoprotein [Bryobacteraceae bacterium]|jgi:NhaP-type Na+/H+ or K+/H+ antiporter